MRILYDSPFLSVFCDLVRQDVRITTRLDLVFTFSQKGERVSPYFLLTAFKVQEGWKMPKYRVVLQ